MARRRRRRLTLLIIVIVLLAGLSVGVIYVLDVARSATNPLDQAKASIESGDLETAEAQLRDLLQARPDSIRARRMLVAIAIHDGRLDEAEALAKYFFEKKPTEVFGLQAMSELALLRLQIGKAIRLARTVADEDPKFAQSMLMRVYGAIGSPESRIRSVRAAEALAPLLDDEAAQAEAYAYAAETLWDLERVLPEGPGRQNLAARRANNHERARKALQSSEIWRKRLPAATALMARIQMLSDDAEEADDGAKTLEAYLADEPSAHLSRATLIRHHARRGRLDDARKAIPLMADAPAPLQLRAISVFAEAGLASGTEKASDERRKQALEIIDAVAPGRQQLFSLLRARLQLNGDEAERLEGMKFFETFALEHTDNAAIVREAYERISRAGDHERGLKLLDDVAKANPDARFGALLERVVASIRNEDQKTTDELIPALADAATGVRLLIATRQLRFLGSAGDLASLALLDHATKIDREEARRARVLRAALTSGRPGTSPDGRAWAEVVREDLRVLNEDENVPAGILVDAATLASANAHLRLAGQLLGRALTMDDDRPERAADLYLRAFRAKQDERSAFATGLRDVPGDDATRGWLERLAAALTDDDASGLRRKAAEAGSSLTRVQAELQLRLATASEDWDEAEAYARHMHAAWPEWPWRRQRIGEILLAAGRHDAVLELHDGEDLKPSWRAQRIEALHALEQREFAIAEARTLVRESQGSDAAMLSLGRLLKDVNPKDALAALAPISDRNAGRFRQAELIRGEILEGWDEDDAAGQVYVELLLRSGYRDLRAWQLLGRVRELQGREAQFILRLTSVINAPPRGVSADVQAQLLRLRGQARESMGDYQRALDDYRRVLEVRESDVPALNNAAWVMAKHIPWTKLERRDRLQEALDLIDRAYEAAPISQILHTRSAVLAAMENRGDDALADLNRALAMVQEELDAKNLLEDADQLRGRRARYLLDKAGLLETLKRDEEARAVYLLIRDEHPDAPQARRAEEALKRLGT